MFPFDDVIMNTQSYDLYLCIYRGDAQPLRELLLYEKVKNESESNEK